MKTKTGDSIPKTLPGAVCAQMVRCGKANCKCARGELHGPYFYHFRRTNGVLTKRYVKAGDVPALRAACEARRRQERLKRGRDQLSRRQLATLLEMLRKWEGHVSRLKGGRGDEEKG